MPPIDGSHAEEPSGWFYRLWPEGIRMVERITIFEPHIEGAQFGPSFSSETDADEADATGGTAASSPVGRIVAIVILGLVAVYAYRAITGNGGDEADETALKSAIKAIPSVR